MSAVVVPTDAIVTSSTGGCCDPVDCCDPAPCGPVGCGPFSCGPVSCGPFPCGPGGCGPFPCGPLACGPFPCGPVDCCDPCCPPLPVARSVKGRVSRGGGSKHEVNSGAAKTVGCKTSYEVPTCLGPAKVTSSRICKVENHQQVKSSRFGRCSNTRKHKVAGCC